jgi:hypothetical protein
VVRRVSGREVYLARVPDLACERPVLGCSEGVRLQMHGTEPRSVNVAPGRRSLKAVWWQKAGIDPAVVARDLWLRTHPLPERSAKWKQKVSRRSSYPSRGQSIYYVRQPKLQNGWRLNDLVQTDPGLPPQRFQEHRVGHVRR